MAAERNYTSGAKVSVCVPNLNTRPFLPERFRSILEQSFQDWELLIYDSYSTDGAWEFIQQLAASEPRMHVWQGPREGAPASWNPCIREARGEYVYIATSDDTMAGDCLQKLVSALDLHPECDIAHCPLKAIDQNGDPMNETSAWWAANSTFAESSGELLHIPHIRRAPFDGLLHLLGGSVYVSITQLLVRRTLFERIGWFESRWGSVGDFNWNMRAGLIANTVHVPDTWGGWRVHSAQATSRVRFDSAEHAQRIDEMIEHAIETAEPFLSPAVRSRLRAIWSGDAKQRRAFARQVAARGQSRIRKTGFIMGRVLVGSSPAREFMKEYLIGHGESDWVRKRLQELDYGAVLLPVMHRSRA